MVVRAGVVTPVTIASNAPGADIAVGTDPQAIAIAPDGRTAYVANTGSNNVTPIDVATAAPKPVVNVAAPAASR